MKFHSKKKNNNNDGYKTPVYLYIFNKMYAHGWLDEIKKKNALEFKMIRSSQTPNRLRSPKPYVCGRMTLP